MSLKADGFPSPHQNAQARRGSRSHKLDSHNPHQNAQSLMPVIDPGQPSSFSITRSGRSARRRAPSPGAILSSTASRSTRENRSARTTMAPSLFLNTRGSDPPSPARSASIRVSNRRSELSEANDGPAAVRRASARAAPPFEELGKFHPARPTRFGSGANRRYDIGWYGPRHR